MWYPKWHHLTKSRREEKGEGDPTGTSMLLKIGDTPRFVPVSIWRTNVLAV